MTSTSFGLTVQELPTRDGALALSHVAAARTESGWFLTRDVADVYAALRIPEPGHLSRELVRLRDNDGYLRVRDGGRPMRWAITPRGRQRVEELIGHFEYPEITAELAVVPGAEFAHARHAVVPPGLAPPEWARPIADFLDRHPFDRNVFLMTRFPDSDTDDPLEPSLAAIKDAVEEHGLTLLRADEHQIVDDLWGNVGAHMWASRYGIGVLETLAAPSGDDEDDPDPALETLNDNVLIEVGSMLTIGRRCMILKDLGAPSPPTDLTSRIYKPVDVSDPSAVNETTVRWILDDLGLV